MVGSDIYDRGLVNRCKCGSYFIEAEQQDGLHFVKCMTCKTQGKVAETREQAITFWNAKQ